MLTPQILNNALMFLSRCDIKGGEAVAFLQTCQALESEMVRLNDAAREAAREAVPPAAGSAGTSPE